jgi:hypothetical protein
MEQIINNSGIAHKMKGREKEKLEGENQPVNKVLLNNRGHKMMEFHVQKRKGKQVFHLQ